MLVFLASTALAMMPTMSRSTLCSRSDLVLIGEVTSTEVVWADDGTLLTRAWVAPLRTLSGALPATVEVLLPGGRIGDVGLWVEDVPTLREDATYLLFLRSVRGGYSVFGGEAGAVAVRQDARSQTEAVRSLGTCRAD